MLQHSGRIVLVDLQLFHPSIYHVKQVMDCHAIAVTRLSFRGNALLDWGYCRTFTFEIQASILIDRTDEDVVQLVPQCIAAGKSRFKEAENQAPFPLGQHAVVHLSAHGSLG